jgi:hypothetical protein
LLNFFETSRSNLIGRFLTELPMATVFQFDECSDCKSFIARCNRQGLATARRFRKKHRGKGIKDPQMLPIYLALGGVLITFDNDMIEKHEDQIPEHNPGIIIIEHSPDVPYTLTQASVEKIIARFKSIVPDWHSVPWANSIVRITEKSVAVFRKLATGVTCDCFVELADATCDEKIRNRLLQNAEPNEA